MLSRICSLFWLLILVLSLTGFSLAQSESLSSRQASSETKELAATIVRTSSAPELERILSERKDLVNSSLLTALRDISNLLVQKGNYPEAVRVSQVAVGIAERISDQPGLASALCDLGSALSRQNRITDAQDRLRKSLTIFETAGDKKGMARALQAIGYTYSLQRRYEQALEYYEKSLTISKEADDRNMTALVLNSMGLAHSSLGHYELGLELYQKSKVLSEELNDKAILSLALNNIGTYYTSQGRYAEALECIQKSVTLIEELGVLGDRRSMAYRLQNIGLIYRHQGRLEQAMTYNRRSLAILEEVDDKFGIANLQNNIGVTYKSQGQYDQAMGWFQKSLKGYQELNATPGVARSLNNIGDVYRLQGRYAESQEQLLKSLELRESNNDRGGITLTLNNLGRLYQDQKNYSEMLKVSRRSASVAEEINAAEELWTAQEQMGRALAAIGETVEARKSFLGAIATIEQLRKAVAGGEQQQQSFLEDRLSPWLGMIDLLVSQSDHSQALSFAEQSKARVLLDTLQGGRDSLRKAMTPQERQAEEKQRLELVLLNSQLTNELRKEKPEKARLASLRAEVEKKRLEFEDFETKLYVAHPNLRVQRGEASIITPEELAALLPDQNGALIEYVVSDDKTYLFVITRGPGKEVAETKVYTLPIKRVDLAKQIESFRIQLASRDLGFRTSAASLYELLLKPAAGQLRGKTNLVIAPDSSLWDLSFQALLTGANRFLMEDVAIAYAPSLTVLREMTRRREQQIEASQTTLLALGNPSLSNETTTRASLRDGKPDPLPEAEQEVHALKRLYGTRSKVYIGPEASEDRVKSEAGQARILHFAAHGVLNNASPMYSHLALAKGDAKEDGLLEAWELMQLDLKADLAVLSACETARGRIGAGEGMIGLSWAMFIAGVPSIVVSQWKVESAGTRDLMVNFHRALISQVAAGKARTTKMEALRQAALKVMSNPQTRHPFYWAGFVLVGQGN